MDKTEYKELRRRVGTWQKVAEMTGECWRTIARRESGETAITRAAELTIRRLEPTWFSVMPPLPILPGEEIRHVPGWEGYAVTNKGRVFTCRSKYPFPEFPFVAWAEKLATKGHRGYWVVSFHSRGRSKQFKLHQVVLMAFVGPKPEGFQGCHFDDNPDNNALANLRWGSASDNRRDMIRNGRNADRKGSKHPLSKLSAEDVERVKSLRAEGLTLRRIGDMFGISEGQVSLISRGKSWRHTFSTNGKTNQNAEEDDTAAANGAVS